MTPIRLLFFSSDSIALPLLRCLAQDPRFVILGVVCQPDKAGGRGQELVAPETKQVALELGLPVYQPPALKQAADLLAQFREAPPDFLLTFAYGQILTADWLDLPRLAPLNVHPSLLPRYRGPSPLQAALLHGDAESGLTLMKMVPAMDAGPIATQHLFPLSTGLTAGELFEAMGQFAAEHIPEDILKIGPDFAWQEQDESRVSFCSKITKESARADFAVSAEELFRRYCAYTPWPGLWTTVHGKRLKVLRVKVSERSLAPGQMVVENHRLWVGCAEGSLEILELQLEGKKALPAAAFIQGFSDLDGAMVPS